MKVVVLVLVAALAMPAIAGARGGEDVRAIRALLQQRMTLLKQGKYARCTP